MTSHYAKFQLHSSKRSSYLIVKKGYDDDDDTHQCIRVELYGQKQTDTRRLQRGDMRCAAYERVKHPLPLPLTSKTAAAIRLVFVVMNNK